MYNSGSAIPYIPYRIIEHLVDNEMLWKLLKYNTYDALSKPNLSLQEKLDLVWKRDDPQADFNVFLTNIIDDAIPESKTIFKLYNYMGEPETNYQEWQIYAFDCLYGPKMSMVDYNGIPANRGDVFVHCILDSLNGANVGGVGKMIYSREASRYCLSKSVIGNAKTFTGRCIYLAVLTSDKGRQVACD